LQRSIAGKRIGWGIALMAYDPIVWLLDWLGRIELLREHYRQVAVFIESPYVGAGALIGGLALIASAIRSGLRKPPGDTPQSPPGGPPPSGPDAPPRTGPLFDLENSEFDATDTQTKGGQALRAKDSKVKSKGWHHEQ
jgi:hypothetical protein